MKLADLDEMAANESEAYMSVQSRTDVGDITKAVNEVVHKKIQQLIADTPAIDAVPVVHGKWDDKGYACGETVWECSVCHEIEWRTSCGRLKYCPFCGAKMDGGGKG